MARIKDIGTTITAPTGTEYMPVDPTSGSLAKATLTNLRKFFGGGTFNVKDYGAVGDVRSVTDAAITTGTATLTSATAAFTSTAVDAGKTVTVAGAGASGAPLATTISTVTNSTTAVLAANAGTTVSGAVMAYGTNDSTAVQAAIDAANAAGRGVVRVPAGRYGIVTKLNDKHYVVIRGDGEEASAFHALADIGMIDGPGTAPAGSFMGVENLTFHGYADRLPTQGGDTHRLLDLNQAERVWVRNTTVRHGRQMGITGIGTVEAWIESCTVNNVHRDGINFTQSGKFTAVNNRGLNIADDFIAFHIPAGLASGTVRSPQCVITGNRFEKSSGFKILGATNIVVSGNAGRFCMGYGVYLGYDETFSEGDKDALNVIISDNSFEDIINLSVVTAGAVDLGYGIYVATPPASQGGLGYYPALTAAGTGTAAVKGPSNNAWNATQDPDTGARGLLITGNVFHQSFDGNFTNFSDTGFGNLWWTSGTVNPAFTKGNVFPKDPTGPSHVGIRLSAGALAGALVKDNYIEGMRYTFYCDTITPMTDIRITGNTIRRCNQFVGLISGGSSVYPRHVIIDKNDLDLDPLFESSERVTASSQPTGAWARVNGDTACAVYSYQVNGPVFVDNVVWNTCNMSTASSDTVITERNHVFADTSVGDNSLGVLLTNRELATNRIVEIDGDPRSTTYGQLRGGHRNTATAMPSSNYYAKNAFVRNETPTPTAGRVTLGWHRLTNGTANVDGTDWVPIYAGPTTVLRTPFSNVNVTAVAADRVLAQTGTLSAARVITLPAASAVPGGIVLQAVDESGSATGSNTLSWARAGSDTINGGTSNVVAVNTAYGNGRIMSDGTSKWTTL